MLEPFTLPFVQHGLYEVLLLAVAGGLLGTWIVLRGLAFHAHAVGTATFPGLVLADGLGFAAPIGALGAALLFTGGVAIAARGGREEDGHGPATALVLVACLAGGIILASDVFHSQANVDTLLFGSLLLIDTRDIALAGAAAVLAVLATLVLGRRWLAQGFDPSSARSLGLRSTVPDAILLVLVAFTAVAALSAVGALLATALLVVPAVTTRLLIDRLVRWQVATVVLAALEGTVGLWLSTQTDAPPGATIAVVAGGVFALAGLLRWARTGRARRAAGAGALLVVAGALLGCGAGSSDSDDGRLDVVASTPVVADLVRNVGGSAVSVTQLLQPNSDPHEYEPRPSDVTKTADADVVVESGFGMDRWMSEVIAQSGNHPAVADLSAGLPTKLPGGGGEGGRFDPHWWHDPENAIAAVGEIERALAQAQPAHAQQFAANATAYVARIRALETGTKRCLAQVPAAERELVTDHDALGYFARRYGIDVVGAVIPSQTTQAQTSAADVAALVKLIDQRDVKAIFPETSVNQKLAHAISDQTGARIGQDLYGDTLGPAGSRGATYLEAEAHNAAAMVDGFSGGTASCAIDTRTAG
jgi:zinc/manganese transport system substrate-binding protein